MAFSLPLLFRTNECLRCVQCMYVCEYTCVSFKIILLIQRQVRINPLYVITKAFLQLCDLFLMQD